MPTIKDLIYYQSLPLNLKECIAKDRIREWINKIGEEKTYISFSGGKDSTVLVNLVDSLYPNNDIPLVFVDTGLEYPEIRDFVRGYGDRVVWLRPRKSFKQVISECGYPFISKEVSDAVSLAKRGYKSGMDKLNGVDKNGEESGFRKSFKKWKFMLNAPFSVSDECCWINKKEPCKRYETETGRYPMLGVMASESVFRKTAWLETGCNAFESKRKMSKPLSTWMEQDVLSYIQKYHLPIASVYGDVVPKENQLSFFEENNELTTTGCDRTGCMYCGYGCHLNNDQRFVRLKETHKQIYDYVFKPESEGGLGYKDKIDWININGKLNIKY